jgi:hypothetical protein
MDQQFTGAPLLDLEIDPIVSRSFREATRWAKFIAIVYSVCLGLLALVAAIGGARFSEAIASVLEDYQSPYASIIGSAVLLIIGVGVVIGGVLLFFLFKFCNQVKDGLERQDQSLFNSGLKSLRNYFMIYGVIAMVYFVLVIVGLIFTMAVLNN